MVRIMEREIIDHDKPTPVYRQLVEILRARIYRGDLAPGSRLPSETELEQEFGLARGTIRKAVDTLRADGLAVTVKGKGSYVADELPPAEAE